MAFVTPSAPTSRTLPPLSRASTCFLGNPIRTHRTPARPRATRHAALPPQCSDMGLSFPERKFDETLRIGVIYTRWNSELVGALFADVNDTLADNGVAKDDIVLMQVPGAYELPMAARLMCASQKVDAVICLGVLIKGETDHYEYIAGAVSNGLMDLQLTLSTPIIFGVLTCRDEAQARARSLGDKSHAGDWALTAIEMAQLKKSQMGGVSAGKKSVGFF